MKRNDVVLFLLVFLLLMPLLSGCKKTSEVVVKEYNMGESVTLPNKTEIVVQSMIALPFYQIPVSVESVQEFPFVYYQKGEKNYRIIKVKEDGSTVDTIIDGVDSPTYQNGYIVEKSSEKIATNSRYLIDVQNGKVFPKDTEKIFVIVNFSYKPVTTKQLIFDPLLYWLEDENKTKLEFDPILSDTILPIAYSSKMNRNQYSTIRLIGLIPSDAKTLYFVTGNARIKWDVETK
ncbi:MAG: hypothetical protein PHD83_00150 [Caldisericia bacterium]|nr:hypothetical protein [Caldisericia bacterium]